MEKKTGYSKSSKASTIGWIIVWAMVIVPFLAILFYFPEYMETNSPELENKILFAMIAFMILFPLVSIFSIAHAIGRAKAKRQMKKEQKLIKKTNPYTYFRELPNSFGIGVTSLLFDSTLENEKDIVAVILDLCARKYLKLEKQPSGYLVRVLKGADENLLSNEKYILDLVVNNNIFKIDYKVWFDYCAKDGRDLGLYTRNDVDANIDHDASSRGISKMAKVMIVIATIITSFSLFSVFVEGILFTLFIAMCTFALSAFILYLVSYPIMFIIGIVNMAKNTAKGSYAEAMNNNLKRTDKGIEELYKLMSFEAFIKDFGNFVEKSAEEVYLWDRYLSYAQVFGLTDEIMKNGYNELVSNASFSIDSIDNISLSEIQTI